jgi:hypothetical protein
MIVEINFFSVLFDVESEYGIGISLTITIFALEGVAIIFSNPVDSIKQRTMSVNDRESFSKS